MRGVPGGCASAAEGDVAAVRAQVSHGVLAAMAGRSVAVPLLQNPCPCFHSAIIKRHLFLLKKTFYACKIKMFLINLLDLLGI